MLLWVEVPSRPVLAGQPGDRRRRQAHHQAALGGADLTVQLAGGRQYRSGGQPGQRRPGAQAHCAPGQNPVLSADQTRHLLDSTDLGSIVGLRDRALMGVMVYTFGRVGAVVSMNVEDYYQSGKRWMFRLHERAARSTWCPPTTTRKAMWTPTWMRPGSGATRKAPYSAAYTGIITAV